MSSVKSDTNRRGNLTFDVDVSDAFFMKKNRAHASVFLFFILAPSLSMARPIRRSPSAVLAIQAKKKRYKHQANKAKGRTREKEARDESQPEVKTNGNSGSSTAKKTQQK